MNTYGKLPVGKMILWGVARSEITLIAFDIILNARAWKLNICIALDRLQMVIWMAMWQCFFLIYLPWVFLANDFIFCNFIYFVWFILLVFLLLFFFVINSECYRIWLHILTKWITFKWWTIFKEQNVSKKGDVKQLKDWTVNRVFWDGIFCELSDRVQNAEEALKSA